MSKPAFFSKDEVGCQALLTRVRPLSFRSEIQSEDAGGVRLTPLLELRFPLLRHWSLFDSMKHAR